MSTRRHGTARVAALWTSPAAERPTDGWEVTPLPDVVARRAGLGAAWSRQGPHPRVLKQRGCDEPLLVTGHRDGRTARSGGLNWPAMPARCLLRTSKSGQVFICQLPTPVGKNTLIGAGPLPPPSPPGSGR